MTTRLPELQHVDGDLWTTPIELEEVL